MREGALCVAARHIAIRGPKPIIYSRGGVSRLETAQLFIAQTIAEARGKHRRKRENFPFYVPAQSWLGEIGKPYSVLYRGPRYEFIYGFAVMQCITLYDSSCDRGQKLL